MPYSYILRCYQIDNLRWLQIYYYNEINNILCDEIGITVTTAFTIFAKKFVRERRLPFTVDADPFYSQKNLTRLKKSIEQLENKGGTIDEISEVLDKWTTPTYKSENFFGSMCFY